MASELSLRRAAQLARRAMALRCPRCGETPLFRGWFTMREACGLCGLRFERAPGYFVGAIYVNYAVTVMLVIGGYLVLFCVLSLSTTMQLVIWLPVVALFPLWFFRYSRSVWLALELFFNPEP
jgi:uncharacterized protein (DUF983 family)